MTESDKDTSNHSSPPQETSLQDASVSESRSPQVATLPGDVLGPLGDVSSADSCSILGGSLITGDTPCVRTEKVSLIRKHMHSIIPQSGGYALSATMQNSILQE
ncbi:hypothetical protein HF325_005398 [Metschnikowia pulcherrima]|uniref:Uncharacterized protein n=1 Tax=Metschnikowia pulcherrima TaxID=27326 RepID=A0A8H7GQ56_9ASCO|nr:hypothetical protein HF325_005398 [Metschnikowia pulcherrima]